MGIIIGVQEPPVLSQPMEHYLEESRDYSLRAEGGDSSDV